MSASMGDSRSGVGRGKKTEGGVVTGTGWCMVSRWQYLPQRIKRSNTITRKWYERIANEEGFVHEATFGTTQKECRTKWKKWKMAECSPCSGNLYPAYFFHYGTRLERVWLIPDPESDAMDMWEVS